MWRYWCILPLAYHPTRLSTHFMPSPNAKLAYLQTVVLSRMTNLTSSP
ncbi:hypothetical protein EVA_08527 [gut metagenome]|uniref:Uncharacterized protein n=1 Tax=gut metagenome TaxID=749906 RepID=J9G929_9ZZZZ